MRAEKCPVHLETYKTLRTLVSLHICTMRSDHKPQLATVYTASLSAYDLLLPACLSFTLQALMTHPTARKRAQDS